ncbi:unnamed protein product [Symbiodinium sp. CCMP2592]|nr:unnamed protein product [Symbiodinium sp. CCMP2592]
MSVTQTSASLTQFTRSFLLTGLRRFDDDDAGHRTAWKIRQTYLEDWPGRVALVVGGSNDMRSVRSANESALKEAGVKTKCLHGRTERDQNRLPPRCLLLITETLFSKSRMELRNSLDLVFDVCEIHRVLQRKEEGCGWSDVLVTLRITQQEQGRRGGMLRTKYCPDFSTDSLPEENPEPWRKEKKQDMVSPPLKKYLGLRFPAVDFDGPMERNLVNLLSGHSPPGHSQVPGSSLWTVRRDQELSFNQLPICHLLNESLRSSNNCSERMACLVAACVLQLVSSKGFELLFRDRAMLDKCDGDVRWLWSLVEAPKFLQTFLTSAGKHDMVCTLVVMVVQWMTEDPGMPHESRHEELRNLAGQSFADFAERVLRQNAAGQLAEVVGWLLSEIMKLAQEVVDEALRFEWLPWYGTSDLSRQDILNLDAPSILPFLRSQFCLAGVVQCQRVEGFSEFFNDEAGMHQLAWKLEVNSAKFSHLQVCHDTGNIRVVYAPKDSHYAKLRNPIEWNRPLLKTVILHYLQPEPRDDGVDSATFQTSGNSPLAAAILSKLVAATSMFLVLAELSQHVQEDEEGERHDGIPAQDSDCCFAHMLKAGVLNELSDAFSSGRIGSSEGIQEEDRSRVLPAEDESAGETDAVALRGQGSVPQEESSPSHVLRLPCTPPGIINPYTRKELVVLALNRFMTPVLLSVTAPVLLLDGELQAVSKKPGCISSEPASEA